MGRNEELEMEVPDPTKTLLELREENAELRKRANQIDVLAAWIIENVPGEPSKSEGAVETAIRLLGELEARGKLLNVEDGMLQSAEKECDELRKRVEALEHERDRPADCDSCAELQMVNVELRATLEKAMPWVKYWAGIEKALLANTDPEELVQQMAKVLDA